MKRSTLFAVLAVVLIMSATVVVLADILHDDDNDNIHLGDIASINTWVANEQDHVTLSSENATLEGRLNGEPMNNRAKVGAYIGGSAGIEADYGAAVWVVGGNTGNHGDVIVVLGN